MDCRLWSNSGQMSLFSSLRNAGFHLCFQEVGRHSSVTLPGSPGQPNQPGFEPLQGKNYPLLSSPQLHSLLQQSSQCALLYFSVCPTSGPRAMPRRRAQPRAPCLHPPAPAALQPHEQRSAAPHHRRRPRPEKEWRAEGRWRPHRAGALGSQRQPRAPESRNGGGWKGELGSS